MNQEKPFKQKTAIITGMFERTIKNDSIIYVGGRLNQETIDKILNFANEFGGLDKIEIVLEPNRNPVSEKSPTWFLLVKEKYKKKTQDPIF